MQIQSVIRLTATLALSALVLCACESARQVPFNEADFKWARAGGSGVVTGRAYIEMKDKSINTGSGSHVKLLPVNTYTTEIITRKYVHGVQLAPADPRIQAYVKKVTADNNGNFSFTGVTPGDYYVATRVHWVNSYYAADAWNQEQTYSDNHAQFIYARITVRNGQTVQVTDWNQVADWNLDTVLH
jgi:hypothetical protein